MASHLVAINWTFSLLLDVVLVVLHRARRFLTDLPQIVYLITQIVLQFLSGSSSFLHSEW